ncbi:hypothetical protein [Nannocystis radixulma]|uniref:DUF1415 domain-containing protein n=1 Tax=Nannocystis radixulma TaxID=2995305 RepID=A0ABT5B319_9BACT|nr:hypothetical protein [Nannocystis radixulma]MDC0668490.1 hypothetical protein [Nannocystis radixulma]
MEKPGPWPPRPQLDALHARYVQEVVEDLSLCPFARKCRELGRLHRPTFPSPPSPHEAARRLADVVTAHPDAEVVLLTFVTRGALPGTPPAPTAAERAFADTERFEEFVKEVRDVYAGLPRVPARFYMVAFHPAYTRVESGRPLTPDSLVPLLRRTPDPVIQCIRADLLDQIRRQAQTAAEARFREEMARLGPEFLILAERAIQSDPELSQDIARHNFASVGAGPGRQRLEAILTEILARRRALELE